MIGFIRLPCGEERKISMHGTINELFHAARLLNLFPDMEQILQMERGESVDLLFFSDGFGSYVTLQAVSEAREFIAVASEV
ncbi:MAG: hypothetical protein ACKODT_07065 [Fluviibacter sp.]